MIPRFISPTQLKAKKSYGQHFLNKPAIAKRIAESLSANSRYDNVLEIGPGTGVLTQHLLEIYPRLKVVEADADMVAILQRKYPDLQGRIVFADFLKVDLPALFDNQPFAIIGNFPYNISSQILFKMLDHRQLVPELVGMFQKEVAERIVAPPGGKDYGILSVLIQAFYQGKYLFGVDKSCFSPPPKVQSAVIRLLRKDQETLGCDEALFKKVVKQAFGQRRKMLRNTMKTFLENSPLLEGDFFKKRPEQLSVPEFIELTNLIREKGDTTHLPAG